MWLVKMIVLLVCSISFQSYDLESFEAAESLPPEEQEEGQEEEEAVART